MIITISIHLSCSKPRAQKLEHSLSPVSMYAEPPEFSRDGLNNLRSVAAAGKGLHLPSLLSEWSI